VISNEALGVARFLLVKVRSEPYCFAKRGKKMVGLSRPNAHVERRPKPCCGNNLRPLSLFETYKAVLDDLAGPAARVLDSLHTVVMRVTFRLAKTTTD
jgi:hypothetical protein